MEKLTQAKWNELTTVWDRWTIQRRLQGSNKSWKSCPKVGQVDIVGVDLKLVAHPLEGLARYLKIVSKSSKLTQGGTTLHPAVAQFDNFVEELSHSKMICPTKGQFHNLWDELTIP